MINSKAQWPKWNKGSQERRMASHPINDERVWLTPAEYVKRPERTRRVKEPEVITFKLPNPLIRPKLLGVWQSRYDKR